MNLWNLTAVFLLAGAAAPPTIIMPPQKELVAEALIIPPDSPVKFKRWDKHGYAVFEGRFVLSGSFTYGCAVDCEGPIAEDDIRADFVPDRSDAAHLPHWKVRDNDISVVLLNDKGFARIVAEPRLHAEIRAGKVPYVKGRAKIVVEDFRTGIECDSANFSARFVKFVSAPAVEPVSLDGDYGCL